MDTTNHQEMNDHRANLESAEEIACENCCEAVIFHLRDKENEFTVGLSTVLECLMFAIESGDLPKISHGWLADADKVCGTSFSAHDNLSYPDESYWKRKSE